MKTNLLTTLSLLLLSVSLAFAGPGTIRGVIKDAKTKDALIGATIMIEGTQIGAAADVEGNFTLANVPVGTHKVIISFVSYKTKEIPNVRVESGNTTVIDTELDEEGTALQEVVVRGSRATNTEVAVISEIKQMKPIAVGISAQQIQKSQDRDAAAAIRRVPGVSIVDNRFVMIRGLGSRYNAVLINDVITPSSEVDTRAFSFDLVPSNIIDRMIVYKSGSAESPGDFAGGVIKIYTKRRPDANFTEAAATIGYRGNTTFQNVQTHDRSGLNFLGLWGKDQTLSSAFPKRSADFNALGSEDRAAFGNLFKNSWGLQSKTVNPDMRFALNLGRRFDIGNVNVSNITNINYSLTNQNSKIGLNLYQNGLVANDVFEKYTDSNYSRQARIGVLHNWTFRFSPVFNLEWKTLFNQLGNTETVVRDGQKVVDGYDVRNYSERFENRSIVTTQVSGDHKFGDLTKLNWITGFGYTGRWEPDWKRIGYQRTTGATSADGQLAPFQAIAPIDPNPINLGRFFSKLNERVLTLAVNGEHAFGNPTDREPNKIRFGIYGERKDRDYSAHFYGYTNVGNASSILQGNIGSIFTPQNVTGLDGGLTVKDGTKDLDSYNGINNYYAAYVSGDLNFGSKAILTLGFRGEYNNQQLHSTVVNEKKELVNNIVFIPLPSLNFTYKLSEKQNLRFAYSSTLNRAEFRELAPFSYFDFNLLADIRGNTALKTAKIQNIDAKWELYPTANELISVTAFYKHFKDPIETFLLPTGNGLAYTFINASAAKTYGVELEIRKGFEQSSSRFFQNLTVVANASLIKSSVDLGASVKGPDLSGATQDYDLTGITDKKRPMQNQSPYLVNAGLYYAEPNSGWQWNILYNVFGQRIFAVGNMNNPTVYEMPRNVVDLNISKKFRNNLEIRLGIQDLLNQNVRFSQDFNHDGKIGSDVTSKTASADQDVRKFKRGSYFTLTAAYTFGKRTIIP
ncbi:TonB-dependent receptor [Dyadobacter frigoris]|uniref:TonB-dependent receptor n=1 Tax=Dyadobacter frigoris TaxID=2576211 RepID=A0A4V6BJQ2_9BACT|nr:TonB-dependent receptor [Dyadobacter frigoris]TKT89763.1 TonB-dependent receptor [Dyadobacter frigoris]GLU54006.1 TonB-dependent receptor [Dyadobacter frigoris]